jgi:hypothetical protein
MGKCEEAREEAGKKTRKLLKPIGTAIHPRGRMNATATSPRFSARGSRELFFKGGLIS